MRYLLIACLGAVFGHSCNAYETLYNRDDSDLRWLYDNQLYGHGFRDSEFNGNFDDYVPSSYRKSLHYPPIVSYHPRAFYDDTRDQLDQWNEGLPLYLTYESLPLVQKKPIYFSLPIIESSSTDGYHYPTPETKYLPPNKEPISFVQHKIPKELLTPKSVYLPPTRKPTTVSPPTTIKTTTTTEKASTPKSLYLPPIVVKPTRDNKYLTDPSEISDHLQPPRVSAAKPILFN